MNRAALVIGLLVGLAGPARADWNSLVKDIGFGDRQAFAVNMGQGVSLMFGCENSSQGTSLKILTQERAPESWRDIPATIQLSIDGGPAIDFPARMGVSAARTYLVSAALNPASAKLTAEQIGAAKRSIAFRITLAGGVTTRSEQVTAAGSRVHAERVVKACLGEAPSEPFDRSKLDERFKPIPDAKK